MTDVHSTTLRLFDADGNVYIAEHAGVWDPPKNSDRYTVIYEDEPIPVGARSLYLLRMVETPPRVRRLRALARSLRPRVRVAQAVMA